MDRRSLLKWMTGVAAFLTTASTGVLRAPASVPKRWAGEVNPSMNIQFNRPYLYPKQKAAIYEPKRYSIIEASTKAGKTVSCIIWMVEQGLNGREGWNYWWVAPVSIQANIAFTRMRRSLGVDALAPLSPPRIILPNGAIIWFKSADKPDSLYGDDVHALVIDEASRVKVTAWYALRSVITATRGRARIIGNVKGRKNWFYQMARKAEEGDPDMAYHKMTAVDAIHAKVLPLEEVEEARRMLPSHVFQELYMAEASEDEGNPFGIEAIKRCTVPLMADRVPAVWGWDLAKSVDWTVGIGMTAEGYVCRFHRWQRVPWEETVNLILSAIGRTPALIDSTGVGDPIVETLQRRTGGQPGADFNQVEGYQFTSKSKQQLMENLALSIQSGGITFPEGPIAIELRQFEYEFSGQDGRYTGIRYSAPPQCHDDCVMALGLADMHRIRGPKPLHIPDSVLQAVQSLGRSRW